ncbi:odorant receptor 94a-like [Sitodiplosis mosellana]|uniref:odorant receptor 94a-like n=1 Tax=Sitodiplosis mosellana TaxID=263140 RepID=UPI00244422E5|nr:odorant receptor 94a-like [Sitodiplosis mosellana]
MKIFDLIRHHFEFVGISTTQTTKHPFNVRNVAILVTFAQFFISSMAFLLFEAKTIREFADSFYAAATTFGVSNVFIPNIFNMANIFQLIDDSDAIIQKRCHTIFARDIYNHVIERTEKWSKRFHLIFVKISLPGLVGPNFLITLFLCLTSDSGPDAFILPFPVLLPFDWRTPIGYLIAYLGQFGTFFGILTLCCPAVCLYVGFCWLSMSFVRDIEQELSQLNESNNKESLSHFHQRLKKIIQFHTDAKELVYNFADIYKFPITPYYLWSVSTICSSLLRIQMEMSQSNGKYFGMINPLFVIFWSVAQIYLFCDFGDNVTEKFSDINDAIYECNWYSFPKEVQRIWPFVMVSAQQPLIIQGFGNIPCTRQAFKSVINGGFSYFTVLRKLQ